MNINRLNFPKGCSAVAITGALFQTSLQTFAASGTDLDHPFHSNHEHTTEKSYSHDTDFSVTYEMDGDTVMESFITQPEEEVFIIRRISLDNRMIIFTAEDDFTSETFIESDYKVFEGLYITSLQPKLYGKEITGSQHIHPFVGSPGPAVFTRQDIIVYKNAAALCQFMCKRIGYFPGVLVMGAAKYLFKKCLNDDPDFAKGEVLSNTYQVSFAVDHSYYIHCYHEIVKSYNKAGTLYDIIY